MQFSRRRKRSSNLLNLQINSMMAGGSTTPSLLPQAGRLDRGIRVKWKKLTAASRPTTTIRAQGGDPGAGGGAVSIDPLDPRPETVDRSRAWVASAAEDPRWSTLRWRGIWQLAGDKREVLQQAWEIYGRTMHPPADD